MARCVICNCEVSNNPFSTKDKYELLNHSFICKTCAHKIGITSIWSAAKYTAKKAKDKYYQWYPTQTHMRRAPVEHNNEYSVQLAPEGKRLETHATTSSVNYEEKEPEIILCETDADTATIINTSTQSNEIALIAETPMEEQQTFVYSFPTKSLLSCTKTDDSSNDADYPRGNTRRLQDTLCSLGIDARVVHVIVGPISVRYELELSPGVRMEKIQCCASDIALALGCEKVTIAPVVGKCSVVGIDVPRRYAETIFLREVLDTHEFIENRSSLTFALGKSAIGENFVCDLKKDRHLLIGGTTGSGKSTLLHSLIISLLYHASPDEVRFVIVDTKGLELTQYNGIPHLWIPVVTDVKKAIGAIHWLNIEIQRRYKIISECGAKSLDSYNRRMLELGESAMSHVVAIVDDVYHLFSYKDDDFEEVIHNIIMRGHIVGVHLVIATQYAYLGAIVKLANLRNMGRISFALPGRYDSIALLGREGAEELSRTGEMLYLPIGSNTVQHIQGCFVSDSEVEAVTGYIKGQFFNDGTVQES